MSAMFESGVSAYVHGVALVEVYFPIDANGKEYVSCDQCFYYRESSRSCALNHETIAFPNRYVGNGCPLFRVTDDEYYDLTEKIIDMRLKEEKDS